MVVWTWTLVQNKNRRDIILLNSIFSILVSLARKSVLILRSCIFILGIFPFPKQNPKNGFNTFRKTTSSEQRRRVWSSINVAETNVTGGHLCSRCRCSFLFRLDAKVPFSFFFTCFKIIYKTCWIMLQGFLFLWKIDLTVFFVIDGRVCWWKPYMLLMLSRLTTLVSLFPVKFIALI